MIKFIVNIWETYKNSQWWHVRIFPNGYGENFKGFILVNIEDLEKEFGEDWHYIIKPALFRPEYAKALKKLLEKTNE